MVTGASGIVGSWLTRRLVDEGAHVVAFVLDADHQSEFFSSGTVDRVTTVNGRLEEYWDIERAVSVNEVDSVVHLGAQALVGTALRSPLLTMEANVRGTYNLLEVCRVHADLVRRIVIASSDKAYGDLQPPPYSEDMPPAGRHPYDLSKACADLIAQGYATTYDVPVAVARAAGTSTEEATSTGVASSRVRSGACSTVSGHCFEAMARQRGITCTSMTWSMRTFYCVIKPESRRSGACPSTSAPVNHAQSLRSSACCGVRSDARTSSQ